MCQLCPRTPVSDVSGLYNKPGDDEGEWVELVEIGFGDYFRPLTATMLNFAYFSPIFNAA
jgi:hypothetical protein